MPNYKPDDETNESTPQEEEAAEVFNSIMFGDDETPPTPQQAED